MNVNNFVGAGNLTRKPETTPVGESSVTKFSVALNSSYKTASGEKKEEVTYLDVVSWGKQGQVIEQYFDKGDPIYVQGEIRQDNWEDKESGQKRSKLYLKLDKFSFLPNGKKGGEDAPKNEKPKASNKQQTKKTQPKHQDVSDDDDDDSLPF